MTTSSSGSADRVEVGGGVHGAGTPSPLDVAAVRRDFPILDQKVDGEPLVYLDSAASSQADLPSPARISAPHSS